MNSQLFPDVVSPGESLQLSGSFLGYTYCVYIDIPQTVEDQLQKILDQRRDIGGCDSPVYLADWTFQRLSADTSTVTHTSEVLLYQDGSNWEEKNEQGQWEGKGVLLCRKDTDLTSENPLVTWRIHIPDAPHQDALIDACGYAYTFTQDGNAELSVLKDYVQAIINDQSAWELLEDALAEMDEGGQEKEKAPQDVLRAARQALRKLNQGWIQRELGPSITDALYDGLELLIAKQEQTIAQKTLSIEEGGLETVEEP